MKFRSPRLSKHRGRARCANKKGIANAKARGVYKGRKASIDATMIIHMKSEGLVPSAIAKALKIGRASVYRALAE